MFNKCLNNIFKSFNADDSSDVQFHSPKLSWRKRWHVKCNERGEEETQQSGRVEKANIESMSSMSRCCDTHLHMLPPVCYELSLWLLWGCAWVSLGMNPKQVSRLRKKTLPKRMQLSFPWCKGIRATFSSACK